MTTAEVEKLIEGQKERPGLDFKVSSQWDAKSLVKDILAMSNLPDGGYIVIGVGEVNNQFVRTGVDKECCATYKLDTMRDQVTKYADPMVDFDLHFVIDSTGLEYVVIKVFSFREVPTICKRDLDKALRTGAIYYRNTNRRVESAEISNLNDLRNLIELAAVRLMQRRRDFGFTVDNQQENYKTDIDAVNQLELVKRIKTKGYCEISITPLIKENRESLQNCLTIVEKSQVQKEWTLPFIPRHNLEGTIDTAENCYQAISELGSRKEVWRMHLSGHFYMINAFVEDWLEGDRLRGDMAKHYPSGKCFFYNTTLVYYLTELYEFIKRLALQGLYKNGVRISIKFKNTANRELILNPGGVPFFYRRTTSANEIPIVAEYSQHSLITESLKLSNEAILKVCDYFKYYPAADTLLELQTSILNDKYM